MTCRFEATFPDLPFAVFCVTARRIPAMFRLKRFFCSFQLLSAVGFRYHGPRRIAGAKVASSKFGLSVTFV